MIEPSPRHVRSLISHVTELTFSDHFQQNWVDDGPQVFNIDHADDLVKANEFWFQPNKHTLPQLMVAKFALYSRTPSTKPPSQKLLFICRFRVAIKLFSSVGGNTREGVGSIMLCNYTFLAVCRLKICARGFSRFRGGADSALRLCGAKNFYLLNFKDTPFQN